MLPALLLSSGCCAVVSGAILATGYKKVAKKVYRRKIMSPFVIEYHSCYAHLLYNFEQGKQRVTEDELTLIDAVAQKYVTMSYSANKESRHTRNRTLGYIVVHRAYLPALLDELVLVFERLTSVTKRGNEIPCVDMSLVRVNSEKQL
jgi:hypothetical protein